MKTLRNKKEKITLIEWQNILGPNRLVSWNTKQSAATQWIYSKWEENPFVLKSTFSAPIWTNRRRIYLSSEIKHRSVTRVNTWFVTFLAQWNRLKPKRRHRELGCVNCASQVTEIILGYAQTWIRCRARTNTNKNKQWVPILAARWSFQL